MMDVQVPTRIQMAPQDHDAVDAGGKSAYDPVSIYSRCALHANDAEARLHVEAMSAREIASNKAAVIACEY